MRHKAHGPGATPGTRLEEHDGDAERDENQSGQKEKDLHR
jgi:hypothetical protein